MKKVLVILLAVFALGFMSNTAGASMTSGWDIYLCAPTTTTSVGVDAATAYFLDNTYFRQNERELNTSCADGAFSIPAEVLGDGGKYCVNYSNGTFKFRGERNSTMTPLGNPGPYAKDIDGFFYKPGQSLNQGDTIVVTLVKSEFCPSDFVLVWLDYEPSKGGWVGHQVAYQTSSVVAGGRISSGDADKKTLTLTVSATHVNAGAILALVKNIMLPGEVFQGLYNPTICFMKSPDGYENQFSIYTSGAYSSSQSPIPELTTDFQGFADSKWQFELAVDQGTSYISLKEPSPFQHFEAGFSYGNGTDDIDEPQWNAREEFESEAIVCWGNNARGMIEDPIMLYENNVDKNSVVVPATLTLAYADAKNDFLGVLKSLDGIFWDWTRYNNDLHGDNVSDVGDDADLNNDWPNREAFLPTGTEIGNCRTGDSVLVFSNNATLLATVPTTNIFGGLAYWVGQNQGVEHNQCVVISVEGQVNLSPRKFILDAALDLTGLSSGCGTGTWVPVDRSWTNLLTHEWFLNGYVGTVNIVTPNSLAPSYSTVIRVNNGNTQDATVYLDATSDDGTVKYFNVLAGTVGAGKTMVLNESIINGLMPGLNGKVFTLRISVAAPVDKVNVFAYLKGPDGRTNIPVQALYYGNGPS